MRRSRKGILFLRLSRVGILLVSILFLSGERAVAVESDTASLLAKIKQLETRLTQIESDQKTILEKQQEIIAQLENLRVWVRRS